MKNVEITRNAPDGPIHLMFGLTYANYFVLPRTLLQSMPLDWQKKFADLVDEYSARWVGTGSEPDGGYTVMPRDESGKFVVFHSVPHYDRGRTLVTPIKQDG